MGNFVTTGSRVSENEERAVLGDLNNGSDEKLMDIVNDSGQIEDYVMSEGASSMQSMKQEENGFHVGDFVWVEEEEEEVNGHQCWPGKIHDSLDASDLALNQMHNGKLLVVYFGNRDFAWCNPSQLKPFHENFKEFSKMSDSRAVEEAVREIGEHVERLLVSDESLVSPLAVNSGVKEGVIVPDVRREIVLSLVLENPGIVLEDVQSLAKRVSFSDLLEIEVLKRKISAFYQSKGKFDFAKYDEYGYIIGLEHKDAFSFDKYSLKGCSGFASKRRKCSHVATTGSTTLRRRVSEISKMENDNLKTSNEKNQEKVSSPRKRKNKRCLDDDDNDGNEKREESNDSNHLEENMEIVVDLSTPLVSLRKRVKVDVSPSVVESSNEHGEKTIISQTGKRERKKSKYLSSEYLTDFSPRARKSRIESESSQIREAERITRIGDTRAEEMLDLIRVAALGMEYLEDYNCSSSRDMLKEFVSVYRSFTYHDGKDNNKIHKRNISDEIKQQDSQENTETEIRNRKGVMEIECLKEKLEEMRSLLDQSEGKITVELMIKLENESRNLLDKVSKMIVPSS